MAQMEGITADPLLGEPLANYPSDRLRPLIAAGVVVAPVALLLGLTTAQVEAWWGPLVTVIGVAFVALIAGWYVLHGWNREIILYQRGFSYREGSNTIFFRYEEIASIRLRAERLAYFGGLLRRNLTRITVTTWVGDQFTITDRYRRADELGTRLTEQTNPVLMPRLVQQIEQGKAIPFGETLRLTATGLHEGDRVLTWAQFAGYRIAERRLAIYATDQSLWLALRLSEIDNVTLLLELLRNRQNHPEQT